MVTVFLTITSIFTMVLQNCLFNHSCKTALTTKNHISTFNVTVYTVCVFLFGLLLLGGKISLYTVVLGLIFGLVVALSNLYKMLSLSSGPMNITLLITTSSMIIPTISGIFWGETFSIAKFITVLILIGFIYLSISKNEDTKFSGKWFLCCSLAFLLQGTVGVLQKIHQSSVHKEEASGFLFVAFLFALGVCLLRNKGQAAKIKLSKKTVLISLICGGCTFGMNYINLKLSGLLPSQLFFPLINGSAIVFSSILSRIIFKEQLTRKQLIGLVGGILSLIAICLVP